MFLKILITTATFPPLADGCSEAAAVLARGLTRLGHDVTVATTFLPARALEVQEGNPRVVQFEISGASNWRVGVQGNTEGFKGFLRKFDGDLVIFENWDAWPTHLAESLLSVLPAKKILVSHGYTAHLWSRHPRFPWGLGLWLGGWPLFLRTLFLMRRFDHLVVLSKRQDFGRFLDHRLARWTGFRNISVISNGAFAREFKAEELPDFRKLFGIRDGLMLLCVANYSDRKNQLMAVLAYRRARLPDTTLVLIGSELNDYAEQVRQLDLELQKKYPDGRVVFLEKLTRPQTCAAYCAADLFVLAAKAETQPIVLLEAMASHTPWLSTKTGCVAELPGGCVVESENEMVENLRILAGSPERRRKLAEEGWEACQQTYDWERVVAAYDQLVKQVAGRGKSGIETYP